MPEEFKAESLPACTRLYAILQSRHGRLAFAFLLLLAGWLLWEFVPRRPEMPKDCKGRLALIDQAITAWATDNHATTLKVPTAEEVRKCLPHRFMLHCPEGGTYQLGTRALATTCSIHGHASVTLPPEPSKFSQAFRRMASEAKQLVMQGHITTAAKNSCLANLKQICGAMDQWALEHRMNGEARPTAAQIAQVAEYLKGSQMPICPYGSPGKYILRSVKEGPICTVVGHSL
jgi:hypothetical protein